jgi:hypothetical protein
MFNSVGTRRTTKGGSLPNRGGEKQQACRSPAAISGFLLFLPLFFFFVLCLVVVAEARSPEQQRETFPNGIEPDLFQVSFYKSNFK